MSPARIRRMEAGDLRGVAGLERRIFPDPWPESAFLREIDEVGLSWPRVAVDAESGEVLAYLVGWFVADEAHLANVAVAPGHRRRGLGRDLVDEFVEEARTRGARMVLLEVRRSNRAAQELYERKGFYRVNVRHRYYRDNGEDAYVMVLPLCEAGRLPVEEGLS